MLQWLQWHPCPLAMTQAAFHQHPAAWRPKHLFSGCLWSSLHACLWAPVFALKCQVRLAASLAFSTVLRQVDSGVVTPERGYLVHVWPEEPKALTWPKSFWGGAAGSRMSGNRSLSGFLAFLPRTSCAPGDLSDHLMRWRLTGVVGFHCGNCIHIA